MNHKEAAIITAYTGVLIGSFSVFHEYIEEILERPVHTIELCNETFWKELKQKSENDFLHLFDNSID